MGMFKKLVKAEILRRMLSRVFHRGHRVRTTTMPPTMPRTTDTYRPMR